MRKQLLAGLALLGAVASTPAMATVAVGDSVTCGGTNGLECSNERAAVGSGTEFGIDFDTFGTLLNADFSAGLLTISNANNPDFTTGVFFDGVYQLFFSNETKPFSFVELGDVTGVENFSAANVGLDTTDGFLSIDLTDVVFRPNASFQVKFDPSTPPPTGAVPEPATWAMMILGFGLVGFAMRRRSDATVKASFA